MWENMQVNLLQDNNCKNIIINLHKLKNLFPGIQLHENTLTLLDTLNVPIKPVSTVTWSYLSANLFTTSTW